MKEKTSPSHDPYLLAKRYGETIALDRKVKETDEDYKNRVSAALRAAGNYQQAHESFWGYEYLDRDQVFEGPFLGVLGATLLNQEGEVFVEDGLVQIQKDIQRGRVFVDKNLPDKGIGFIRELLGVIMPLWVMKEKYGKEAA